MQVSLELFHDAHDDTCEAWVTEERRFSLLPLRAAYTASYGAKEGKIVIHVAGSTTSWTF